MKPVRQHEARGASAGVACLTTSWDDGHPLDLRVAELLTKYGLPGTFYVPKHAEHGTMSEVQIRQLSLNFELGAHTLNHPVLPAINEHLAEQEISGSKHWLEDTAGMPCTMFCPPRGRYSGRHLRMVQRAGYLGLRNVELLSLARPRPKSGVMLMPTSVQAYPHKRIAYARNALKRGALGNFRRSGFARSGEWPDLAHRLLHRVIIRGGVFHLWGHSWELEQTGQWGRLEQVLRMMSDLREEAARLTNGQVCRRAMAWQATARPAMALRQPEPF